MFCYWSKIFHFNYYWMKWFTDINCIYYNKRLFSLSFDYIRFWRKLRKIQLKLITIKICFVESNDHYSCICTNYFSSIQDQLTFIRNDNILNLVFDYSYWQWSKSFFKSIFYFLDIFFSNTKDYSSSFTINIYFKPVFILVDIWLFCKYLFCLF